MAAFCVFGRYERSYPVVLFLYNGLHKRSETSCVPVASHWLQGAVPRLFQPGVLPMARQSLPGLQGDNPSFLSERAFLPRARESSMRLRGGARRRLRPARPRGELGGSIQASGARRRLRPARPLRRSAAPISKASELGGSEGSAAPLEACETSGWRRSAAPAERGGSALH